jgi:D-alanine-D-alanine ligase-like ATP-grasp enzyme
MLAEAVKAVRAVGLDFGACDVRVQGNTYTKGDRTLPRQKTEIMVIEVNSAPSTPRKEDTPTIPSRTEEAYKEMITELVNKK